MAFGHRLAGQLGNIGFGHFGQQPKADAKSTEGGKGDVIRCLARAAQNIAGVTGADARRFCQLFWSKVDFHARLISN